MVFSSRVVPVFMLGWSIFFNFTIDCKATKNNLTITNSLLKIHGFCNWNTVGDRFRV